MRVKTFFFWCNINLVLSVMATLMFFAKPKAAACIDYVQIIYCTPIVDQ